MREIVTALPFAVDASSVSFGVHRMALAGKELGKDVGFWLDRVPLQGRLQ